MIDRIEAQILNSPIARTDLAKVLDRYRDEERKKLRADLAGSEAKVTALETEALTLNDKLKTLTTLAVNHEKTVSRLEEEKTAYLSACPGCATRQIEIDRTAEAAASWFAQEIRLKAEADARVAQAREDERKRARFTELKLEVEQINAIRVI